VKLTAKMLEELEYAAYRDEVNCAASKTFASHGHAPWVNHTATRDALLRRGLITYVYRAKDNPSMRQSATPVLTAAGWAVVRPDGRPADGGRLTLEEALEDAGPAWVGQHAAGVSDTWAQGGWCA